MKHIYLLYLWVLICILGRDVKMGQSDPHELIHHILSAKRVKPVQLPLSEL